MEFYRQIQQKLLRICEVVEEWNRIEIDTHTGYIYKQQPSAGITDATFCNTYMVCLGRYIRTYGGWLPFEYILETKTRKVSTYIASDSNNGKNTEIKQYKKKEKKERDYVFVLGFRRMREG